MMSSGDREKNRGVGECIGYTRRFQDSGHKKMSRVVDEEKVVLKSEKLNDARRARKFSDGGDLRIIGEKAVGQI